MFLSMIVTFCICYAICAINPAIILSKLVLKEDIRNLGSKNAGTTNSIRTMGKKWGALVFILDLLKVIIAYYISYAIYALFKLSFNETSKSVCMLACIIGHVYPIYYGFRGGKGVAVYLMSALLIDYRASLVCIVVGIFAILITRWVSFGSISGTVLLVIISIFMDTNFNFIILLIATVIIVYKHKENIKKILSGKENKLF